jgi:dipeptidyl-peptidase-4
MNNNLYLYDLATKKTKAITTDGKWNHIINGNCDWVYEEEFEFSQAYDWSPKGSYIAYYRFDESKVREYEFTMFDNEYNKQYSYKYPKAGEANSKVDIYIYNVATGKKVKANYEQGDIYIPRIKWTQADNELVVYWMNRHQDDLKLLLTNAQTGAGKSLYEEKINIL